MVEILQLRSCLALVALLAFAALPVAAGPPGTIVVQAPIASIYVDDQGALVSWFNVQLPAFNPIPEHPLPQPPTPDGFNVYRANLTNNGSVDGQPTVIGFVAYQPLDPYYTFLDASFHGGHTNIYFVRAVVDGVNEAQPSNPVSTYPPCDAGSVGLQAPYVTLHPECIIPAT